MVNAEEICWITALVLGMICFLGGIFNIIYKAKKNGACEESDYSVSLLFEFAANWFLNLPDQFFNVNKGDISFLHGLEAVFSALLVSLKNSYSRVVFDEHAVFTNVYSVINVMASLALYFFLAGFIIKYFETLVHKIRLSEKTHRKNAKIYIMSECNEKTLSIAESIEGGSVIFAQTSHPDSETKKRLADIRAVYVDSTVDVIMSAHVKKSASVEMFLFGEKEADNLSTLENVCKSDILKKIKNTRIYVEINDIPCDLYDGYTKKIAKEIGEDRLTINFLRTEENYAYNNLLKISIFDNFIEEKDVKKINVLFIGMNERNLEMLKGILHLGQMPGFSLNIMVIEPGHHRGELRRLMPEVTDSCQEIGDSLYTLTYLENVDLESDDVERTVSEHFPQFTYAYVNAGDDLFNLKMAMRLNSLKRRLARGTDYTLQACVLKLEESDMWNKDLTANIRLTGSFKNTYNYNFITMSDIENGTKAIHYVRQNDKKRDKPDYTVQSWETYCNDEYNRHSVYARTLSFKYKVLLIDKYYGGDYTVTTNRTWKMYEHMRWNMYTRTAGRQVPSADYIAACGVPKGAERKIAGLHEDLVPFNKLPKEEQEKDALRLTPEIVEVLKEI